MLGDTPLEVEPTTFHEGNGIQNGGNGAHIHLNPLTTGANDLEVKGKEESAVRGFTEAEALEDEDDVVEDVQLNESMWDAALLFGLHGCPRQRARVVNAVSAVSLLLNIILQLGLGIIIAIAFIEEDFTDATVAGYRVWRRTIAHG